VLNCLMVAAIYDESIDASAIAKVACSLVSKAIDRLDSVEIASSGREEIGSDLAGRDPENAPVGDGALGG
jgi:hypothetical protein